MLSRAWSYWSTSETTETNNNNNNTSEDLIEKNREDDKNNGDRYSTSTTTTTTTTTTIEHTSYVVHSHNNGNSTNGSGGVEEEKTRGSSSTTTIVQQQQHYTFNPIQYHYAKVCKSRTTMVVSHSTPMSLPLDQFLHYNKSTANSSPRQNNSEKKAVTNSGRNSDSDDNTTTNNNDDSSVMTGASAMSITSNNNVNGEHAIITRYFDSIPVTSDEREALFELHKWISNDTLSNKMKEELCLGDMIMSYYSSFSRSNPDAKGCWKRWISYRDDSPLKDVNFNRIKEFFATGLYNVGYDREGRPVFIINTKYYDDSFGPEITAKATMLFITSLLWNIRTNDFDFNALRKGVCVYADLSHYSINMLAWNVIQACKSALVAFPFQLIDIYCVNTPTFVYMLRQIASKIIVPHAMEKIKVLGSPDEYFEKYGVKEKTPVENGGTWKISTTQWMKERGFVEAEDKN